MSASRRTFHHRFKLDRTGAGAGDEWDVQLARKLGEALAATAKLAEFRRDHPAFPDVRKIWLQVEWV